MERLTKVMDKYLKKAAADWDKKKVLTLTINKEWFDMIVAGEKTEEYRVIKEYWVKRIIDVRKLHRGTAYILRCLKNNDSMLKNDIILLLGIPYTHVLFITATARIVHELRRRLRVSPSASLRKVFVPTNGLILSFL